MTIDCLELAPESPSRSGPPPLRASRDGRGQQLLGPIGLVDPDTGEAIVGRVRPFEPSDTPRLVAIFERLSPTTVYRRFLSPIPRLSGPLLRQLIDVDHDRHEALVIDIDGDIVAVARYVRTRRDPATADVAVTVEDRWQRNGLATQLLDALMALAARRGVRALNTTMLASNVAAERLVRRRSPDASALLEDGVLDWTIPLASGLRQRHVSEPTEDGRTMAM